jgi:hypothetical protein
MNLHPSAARHPMIIALVVLCLALVGVTPSMAAPAATNDDIANATVISSIPFTDNVDTTGAQADPSDPQDCYTTGSVWYTFTPSADIQLEANTFGSSYDTVLSVFSGAPGSLTSLDCNDDYYGLASRVTLSAVAGTTYYFMAATCCGYGGSGGGDLVFSVNELPPPLEIDLTLNRSGSVSSKTGDATIGGTVTCNNDAYIDLYGDLTQSVGRLKISGSFYTNISCTAGQATPWTATITSSIGKYAGGKALANVDAFGCDNYTCAYDSISQAQVQLRSKSK